MGLEILINKKKKKVLIRSMDRGSPNSIKFWNGINQLKQKHKKNNLFKGLDHI